MWYSDGETTEVLVAHRAPLNRNDLTSASSAGRATPSRAWVRDVVVAACVVVGGVVLGGADCAGLIGEGEGEPKPCTAHCDVEVNCDFRTDEECKAASCNKDGTPKDQAADDCLAAAADCLEAAACACDGGCARIDECSESEPNPECVSSCDTLVEQQTTQTYLENRCRIEKSCDDLATCSAVSG